MWVWIVAYEFEVLVLEIEETLHVRVNLHRGQGARLSRQLQLRLLDVVQIEVGVACGVDKVARLIARHLSHHLEEQGVRGDVEGHPKESIS